MEQKKKRSIWIVKVFTGYKTGWQPLRIFNSSSKADEWLCNHVKRHGYSITDFNIVKE